MSATPGHVQPASLTPRGRAAKASEPLSPRQVEASSATLGTAAAKGMAGGPAVAVTQCPGLIKARSPIFGLEDGTVRAS